MMDESVLDPAFCIYWDAGYQLHIHVNADAGLDRVLGTLEANLRRNPRQDHRTVLAHFAVSAPDQVARIRQLGVIVGGNPITCQHSPTSMPRSAWGRSAPTRWFDLGISTAPACAGRYIPSC